MSIVDDYEAIAKRLREIQEEELTAWLASQVQDSIAELMGIDTAEGEDRSFVCVRLPTPLTRISIKL